MSVPMGKRKPSPIQFLETARELAVHTLKYTNKTFAKKDTDVIRRLRDLAINIFNNASAANSVFVATQEDKAIRRQYLVNARGDLFALSSMLSVVMEVISTEITEYGWSHWGELIDKEIRLITALMKKDIDIQI